MSWVTDLSHFIDETGNLPIGLPTPARRLAEQLTAIVAAATAGAVSSRTGSRRPGTVDWPSQSTDVGPFAAINCALASVGDRPTGHAACNTVQASSACTAFLAFLAM